MGVIPVTPLSKWHYSASRGTADNTFATYGLLVVGVLVTSLIVVRALRTVHAVHI